MRFADVVGHAAPLHALTRAMRDERLPHALLFTGPPGVGKATVAGALIAARFCIAPQVDRDSCGACASCRSLAHGNHPDHERLGREPGKRDIGIGQVRTVLDSLHRKPHRAAGKAALIDDAERMTAEAQNAFLKTLEEPPPGSLLLLVTTSAERVLPTVRSRCQIVRFARLSDDELDVWVKRAASARTDAGHNERLARVPRALAAGSPGQLDELAAPGVLEMLDVLTLAAGGKLPPIEAAARLLEGVADDGDGEGVDDDRESRRERLLLAVRMLRRVLRDRLVQCAIAPDSGLDPDLLLEALERCELAVADLSRNVDPMLALVDLFEFVRVRA